MRVLPCAVEKRSEFAANDDTIAVDTVNVLPCANENMRRFIFMVEPIKVDDALHMFVFIVLPTVVETPFEPATILETFAIEVMSVLPCPVENTILPMYNVEPAIVVDRIIVLP